MKRTLLLLAILAGVAPLSANPKALIEASANLRTLFKPLLAQDLSTIGSREEKHLRMELDRLYRSTTLIGALWHQARRSRGRSEEIEEYRMTSLTCLEDIKQSVPNISAALTKTHLRVPADTFKARSQALHSLAEVYQGELSIEKFPADEEKPNKAPEPTTTAVTSPAAQETRQP